MRKFFYCIFLFCLSSHSYANKDSCHSIFLSVSQNRNITRIKGYKLKFLTDDEKFSTGFDIAYNYGLSENLYIGLGLGFWSSTSAIFNWKNNDTDSMEVVKGFVLDGKYLKFPLTLRFYFHDYLNVLKVYLYGDTHLFYNVSSKMNESFKDLYSINGKKLSMGSGLGGGLNLSITPTLNIFAECFFTLRPFFAPVEIKIKNDNDNDKTGDFKINNVVISFGLHLDFSKTENDLDPLY